MKIKIYDGCTDFKLLITDKKGEDISSVSTKKLLLEKLVYDLVESEKDLDKLLEQLLSNQEPFYQENNWCEECGDDIEYCEYKLNYE